MSLWRRDCICGSPVTADPDDPRPGVAYHNAQQPHRSWSDAHSWAPPPEQDSTAGSHCVDVSAVRPVRPVPTRRRYAQPVPR